MLTFHGGRLNVSALTGLLASSLFEEREPAEEQETRHVRLTHPKSDLDLLVILHRNVGRIAFDLHVAIGTPAEIDAEFPATKKKEPAPCPSTPPSNA